MDAVVICYQNARHMKSYLECGRNALRDVAFIGSVRTLGIQAASRKALPPHSDLH